MIWKIALVLIIFIISLLNNVCTHHVIVNIPGQGEVLGNFDTTKWTEQTFMQFRGIPYAESPKGKRRFKPTVARLAWSHILNATAYGRRCPVITTVAEMSQEELQQDLEDCLNLCVYTKDLTKRQPVMFYIYGGGFYNGSSSDHPPRHLLEKDIVLVVAHYRVGALGWLTTLTKNMPGNVPVHDLVLALQWVRRYIHNLGGNAENVTIFSQSAGAMMTGALLLSPKTPAGLFKRAIIQSGSIIAEKRLNRKPLQQVERICRAVDCANCAQVNEAYKCLNALDVLKLLQFTTEESFAPTVGDFNGILPQAPSALFENYNGSIPIMTGFTKHDGSFVLATYYDTMKQTVGNLSQLTVAQFAAGLMDMIDDTTCLTNHLETRLLFKPFTILNSAHHKEAIPAYIDLTSIQSMKSPVIAFATKMFQKRRSNIYLYSFDYYGENTRFGYEFGNAHYPFDGGVHHSNDNIYLFSTHQLNANDTEMSKKMVDLWASFAIDGVPSTTSGPVILPMKNENGPYYRINQDITIGKDILDELTAAIDDPNSDNLIRKNVEF